METNSKEPVSTDRYSESRTSSEVELMETLRGDRRWVHILGQSRTSSEVELMETPTTAPKIRSTAGHALLRKWN